MTIPRFLLLLSIILSPLVLAQQQQQPSPTGTGSTDCLNNPKTPECDCGECEKCKQCDVASSESGSYVHNGRLGYNATTFDFKLPSGTPGCGSCGDSSSLGDGLHSVSVARHFNSRRWSLGPVSSFGATTGLAGYDYHLKWTVGFLDTIIDCRVSGNVNPNFRLRWKAGNMMWVPEGDASPAYGLTLYDAAGNPITAAANRALAHTALYLKANGDSVHFEIIRTASEAYGRPIAFADRNGNITSVEYNDAQPAHGTSVTLISEYFRRTKITDPYGRELLFEYTLEHNEYVVSKITHPDGRFTTYDYGFEAYYGGNVITQVNHPDGSVTTHDWNYNSTTGFTELAMFEATGAPGKRRKTVYITKNWALDDNGVSIWTSGSQARMVLNGEGEMTHGNRATPSGDRLIYEGGNKAYVVGFYRGVAKHEEVSGGTNLKTDFFTTDISTLTVRSKYDFNNVPIVWRPSNYVDSFGREVIFPTRHPVNLRETRVEKSDGTARDIAYNTFDAPTLVTDRLGRVTKYEYDLTGNLIRKTHGFGSVDESVEEWLYNAQGLVTEHRDALYDPNFPELHNTRYEYDANNFPTKVIQSADVAGGTRPETVFTWDSVGRLATTTDPAGRTVAFTYDVRSRLIETLYADGSTELITYGTGLDANLVLSRTDRNGFETTFSYDDADRAVTTVTAANTSDPSVETCTYLSGTRLKETCTRDGEKTAYTYDHQNRLVATTRHTDANSSLTTTSEIDILGRTRSTTDAYGRRTFYLYDENDRLTRTVTETVPDGLGTVPAFANNSTQTAQQVTRNINLTNGETITLEGIHEVTYTDARDLFLKNLTRDLNPNAAYLITDRLIDAEGQTLTTTDARGIEILHIHDTLGRTIRTFEAITLPEERLTEVDYDDASNVTEQRHPRFFSESIQARDTFTYNGRNLRATHTTAPGSSIAATQSWTYYLDGRANEHTDFRGNIAKQIWHTCCGRLQASIDRDGQSTTIYNTDRKGQPIHTATVTQNPGGNWTDPVDADTLQESTTRFDGRGRTTYTTVWLQPLGDIGTCCGGSGTNPIPIAGLDSVPATDGLTTSYTYDDNLTDGIGIDNTYAAKLAQLASTGTVFGPGSDGSAMAMTNPEGETTVRISDGLGRTVMTIDPEGETTIIEYDQTATAASFATIPAATPVPGDLLATSATDANGNTSTSYSDGAGRTIASEDAIGSVSFAGYDANSNVVATRDPNGLGQDCTFDALNRDLTCADLQEQNDTTFRSKTYNAASQVVTSTDAEGKVTSNEYDVRGRLTSTTDPNLIEVSYVYDANNNLTELTDGENHTRTWSYNSRNLVTEKQYPGNTADDLEYTYDALRRLSVKVDQLDDTVYHIYDLAGRLIEKEYRTGGSVIESTDTFTYDAASRLLTTTKGRYGVTTAHTWNTDSTPASESFTADGRTYTSSRTYDAGNRPLTHTYPDGNATTWGYDARNLVTSVSYEGQSIATQAYDDGYRLTGQTLGNGLTRTIAYGRDDNMRTADTTFDGTALDDLDFSYSYAIDKQVSAETIATDLVPDASFTASYDDGNRVTGWDRPGAPGTIRNTQSWSYDDAGNWDSTTVDGTTENRSHTTADQISLIAGVAVANDAKGNLTTFTYDKPTLIGPVSTDYILEWDLDNRLKKATVDNDDVEYRYDALGRRVLRKEGTNETALIWWGDSECAEYEHKTGQPCIQNDIFAHPSALNTVIARAVDGNENDLQWYHKNYLDHVYAVSDDGGAVIEHYRYSAFGEIEIFDELGARIASTQIGNSITWNTRRLDSLTEFYLYKYRHYSPQLGRWPSRDPIEEEGGINLYGFVGNDGVNALDVLGNTPVTAAVWIYRAVSVGLSAVGIATTVNATATSKEWSDLFGITDTEALDKGISGVGQIKPTEEEEVEGCPSFDLQNVHLFSWAARRKYWGDVASRHRSIDIYLSVSVSEGDISGDLIYTASGTRSSAGIRVKSASMRVTSKAFRCGCKTHVACLEGKVQIRVVRDGPLLDNEDQTYAVTYKVCGDGAVTVNQVNP